MGIPTQGKYLNTWSESRKSGYISQITQTRTAQIVPERPSNGCRSKKIIV